MILYPGITSSLVTPTLRCLAISSAFSYPCRWGGLVDGKPLVAGLEVFGSRALNNLWNAIQKHFPDEVLLTVVYIKPIVTELKYVITNIVDSNKTIS